MSIGSLFWAQQALPTDLITGQWKKMSGGPRDLLTVLGAMVGVTLLIFLWAAFFRRRRRHHARHHGHHHESHPTATNPLPRTTEAAAPEEHLRRKRRRRRAHRPRNPTLAETGGLPPVRSERPPEPSA